MLTPEQKLWRAVLGQAYVDAEPAPDELEIAGFVPPKRAKAQRFLRADTPHDAEILEVICDFAEVPCECVVLWARERYAASSSSNAAAA
jgi:hypothetical protein